MPSLLALAALMTYASLVFTPRKRIEPEHWDEYRATGGRSRAGYAVPHPFRRGRPGRAKPPVTDTAP